MTAILPPDVLDDLAALNEANLPESALVEHEVDTEGPGGTSTKTWTTVGTFPCRVSPTGETAQEQLLAQQFQGKGVLTVSFKAGTDVRLNDRVTVSGNGWTAVLRVIASTTPRTNEVMRKFICEYWV